MKRVSCHIESHIMRRAFFLLFLSVLASIMGTSRAYGQTSLWVAAENAKAYVLEQGQVVQYDFRVGKKSILRQSLWAVVDSFPTLGGQDAVQKFGNPYVFEFGDSTVFSFSGSGVLFGMGAGKLPRRMDHTYYSGYNFESFRGIHDNTLYSYGGAGFWSRSPALIYYDATLKEWERITATGSLPEDYAMLWAAERSPGVYITSSFPDPDVAPNTTYHEVYELNISERSNQFLGYMQLDLDDEVNEYEFIGHLGHHFLIQIDKRLYVGDILQNKLYQVLDMMAGTGSFNGYEGVFISGGKIVLVYSASTMTNPNVRITTLTIEELINRSVEMEHPLYISRVHFLFAKYTVEFLAILISILFLAVFLVRYNLAQPGVEKQLVESLSEAERRLLRFLILLPDHEKASMADIDSLLDTADKSWENQRKIRSKAIQSVNNKAEERLGYLTFIQRVPNPEDMRERAYRLSPEYKTASISLLRHL